MGITYYTGNWGQDLEDNLTETQSIKNCKNKWQNYHQVYIFVSRKFVIM